jgi:hypothetical protein
METKGLFALSQMNQLSDFPAQNFPVIYKPMYFVLQLTQFLPVSIHVLSARS